MYPGPDQPTTELPVAGAWERTEEQRQPGWYEDPWTASQQRFWTGEQWTHDTAPGAVATGEAVPAGPVPPFPPLYGGPPPGEPQPLPSRRRSRPALIVAVAVLVGFAGGLGGAYLAKRADGPTRAPAVAAGDPAAAALAGLVVTQADVPSSVTVNPLNNGNQVSGQTTLDVCNGTYPSESLRTARLQVFTVDSQSTQLPTLLSTEAVIYTNSAATAQAFAELRRTVAACPSTPVVSPVGEPTVTTHFNASPDGGWPQVAGVERLALDFNSTDTSGASTHSVAVYMRRGRVLLGVYFPQPGPSQSPVGGRTTMSGIVDLFARRMAALPAAVVKS